MEIGLPEIDSRSLVVSLQRLSWDSMGRTTIAKGAYLKVVLKVAQAGERPAPDLLGRHAQPGQGGGYCAENNAWGKGALKGWCQCIGLAAAKATGVHARWTWDWLDAGDTVKAYPEVIVGTKPGSAPTSTSLPRRVSALGQLQASLALESRRTGNGKLAFDLWLTNTATPSQFGVPPISHKLMIWHDAFGTMQPAGQRRATVKINGRRYDLYVNDHHGMGWRYIAYLPTSFGPRPARGQVALTPAGPRASRRFQDTGLINLKAFLEDSRARQLISGSEFLASVELGNELISGQGETLIHHYSLVIK